MSLSSTFLTLVALPLRLGRRHRPRISAPDPRILVIRRNRLGDMIYTVPLLHALRRHYPQAHLAVACDPPGAPIAQACPAVDEVIVLSQGWTRWLAVIGNGARLQNFDWVIAAKGGVNRRLAVLTRLTNAAMRIGFVRRTDHPSACYTHLIALPEKPNEEHQIETLLRLLRPLGLINPKAFTLDLSIRIPESSMEFAEGILSNPPFAGFRRFLLINLSSTVRLKFREENFIELANLVLGSTDLAIGIVAAPADQAKAGELAARMASDRVTAVATPGPLDLAALLKRAVCLLTPEGGAAHLAATVNAPALILWSEGPFQKWQSRASNHVFVQAERRERVIPTERVWKALQPFLVPKK